MTMKTTMTPPMEDSDGEERALAEEEDEEEVGVGNAHDDADVFKSCI